MFVPKELTAQSEEGVGNRCGQGVRVQPENVYRVKGHMILALVALTLQFNLGVNIKESIFRHEPKTTPTQCLRRVVFLLDYLSIYKSSFFF